MSSDVSRCVSVQADGLLIRVLVQPKSRREGLAGIHDDRVKLSVTEPPDKGKANAAVIQLLAQLLNVPRTAVEIIRGDTNRRKDVLIHSTVPDSILSTLAACLESQ